MIYIKDEPASTSRLAPRPVGVRARARGPFGRAIKHLARPGTWPDEVTLIPTQVCRSCAAGEQSKLEHIGTKLDLTIGSNRPASAGWNNLVDCCQEEAGPPIAGAGGRARYRLPRVVARSERKPASASPSGRDAQKAVVNEIDGTK